MEIICEELLSFPCFVTMVCSDLCLCGYVEMESVFPFDLSGGNTPDTVAANSDTVAANSDTVAANSDMGNLSLTLMLCFFLRWMGDGLLIPLETAW